MHTFCTSQNGSRNSEFLRTVTNHSKPGIFARHYACLKYSFLLVGYRGTNGLMSCRQSLHLSTTASKTKYSICIKINDNKDDNKDDYNDGKLDRERMRVRTGNDDRVEHMVPTCAIKVVVVEDNDSGSQWG